MKADGLALLKDKKDRKLVTFHDSMTYFAKTFDLKIVGVVQKNPGTEPNDEAAEEADRSVRRRQAPGPGDHRRAAVRFFQLRGPSVVKELRHEKVPDPVLVEIDPLETVAPDQLTADWYETKMRANLEALAKAMK